MKRPDCFKQENGGPKTAEKTEFGGPDQDRTDDLLIANEALSQLSYGPGNA